MNAKTLVNELREGHVAEVRFANLTRANLAYADLRGVVFEHCCLRAADLRGADISNATFRFVDLDHATLRECQCDGARFEHVRGWAMDASESRGRDCHFISVDIRESQFEKAELPRALFRDSHLGGISMRRANLTDSAIHDCNCERTSFEGAELDGFSAVGSVLCSADFTDAQDYHRCRDVVMELLARRAPGEDVRLHQLIASIQTRRHWCYDEWRDYLVATHPEYLEWAIDVFSTLPRSGVAQALSVVPGRPEPSQVQVA